MMRTPRPHVALTKALALGLRHRPRRLSIGLGTFEPYPLSAFFRKYHAISATWARTSYLDQASSPTPSAPALLASPPAIISQPSSSFFSKRRSPGTPPCCGAQRIDISPIRVADTGAGPTGIAQRAGIDQKHPGLTVSSFTHFPTVLTLDSNLLLSLFEILLSREDRGVRRGGAAP